MKQNILNTTNTIFTITRKNIKILMRTKASILITLIGPLLLIFLAGIAFDNTNLYSVKIGTYSEAYNTLSNSFIEKLYEKQFKTQQYPTEEKCADAIKEGDINACIVFAPNFKLAQNRSNEITFYLDYSKLNLVWTITSLINEQITSRSKELSTNLTAEVVRALDTVKNQVQKRKNAVTNLATQNDEASKHIYDTVARLEELDLSFDAGQKAATNLSIEKNRVQHWVQNSVELGDSALQKALQYISAIDDLVKASTAPNDLKTSIHDYLKTTVADIGVLQERMTTTKNILGQQSTDFDSSLASIINNIGLTKTKVDSASSARQLTIEELNTVKTLLDKALINILELQKSLNEMEKSITTLQVTEPSSLVQPITTHIKPIVAEKSYLNYLFPTLILLVIMYTAILLTPILILLERNAPAYFRNNITPTKDYVFIISTFITSAILLFAQLFIIIVATTILFSSQVLASLFITLFIAVLVITLFTLIGMCIGYLFNTEETAILTSTTLATALLFFSDTILPIETMAPWLGALARINPFVVASELLRKTIVLNATINVFWQDLILLIFYCAIAATAMTILHYNAKKHNIMKYFISITPTKEKIFSKINPKFARMLMRK